MDEKKPFSIKPKDRKLLKSSRVRKWLKDVEEAIKKDLEQRGIL